MVDYGDLNALENALKAHPNVVAFMAEGKGFAIPPAGIIIPFKRKETS